MTAPVATSVRAGDRDRETTANQLGQALSQGYLAMDEYENRLRATFAAHTTAELRQLVADLPLAQLRRNDPQRQAARRRAARLGVRIHLGAYLAMVVIVLVGAAVPHDEAPGGRHAAGSAAPMGRVMRTHGSTSPPL